MHNGNAVFKLQREEHKRARVARLGKWVPRSLESDIPGDKPMGTGCLGVSSVSADGVNDRVLR